MTQPTNNQAAQPPATPSATPDPEKPADPPETPPLALTLGKVAELAAPAPPLGVDLGAGLPQLTPDLATALRGRDRLLVVELVRGATWSEACDTAGVPERHKLRGGPPPSRITRAVEWLISRIAERSATSRDWIRLQLVALYNRACQAEPVLDKRGQPTGIYRFDGMTARSCLELLGADLGMFKRGGGGIAPQDVADLLRAVAARGKPGLPGDNARVIEQSAAAQQGTQAADSASDTAQQSAAARA